MAGLIPELAGDAPVDFAVDELEVGDFIRPAEEERDAVADTLRAGRGPPCRGGPLREEGGGEHAVGIVDGLLVVEGAEGRGDLQALATRDVEQQHQRLPALRSRPVERKLTPQPVPAEAADAGPERREGLADGFIPAG